MLIGALSTALLFVTMGANVSKSNSPIPALEISDSPALILDDLGGAVSVNGEVYQVVLSASPI